MKMWDPYAEFRTTTLPNGLTVRAAHWPGKPWQYVGFVIHSGARHDPVGKEGLHHFVEHLVFQNAALPLKDLERFFKNSGGNVNTGITGYQFTSYGFELPLKKAVISKALDIFGRTLFAAQLRKKVEHERQVIVGEFGREYQNGTNLRLERRQNASVFGDTFLSRFTRPLGSPESIARSCISQRDLQECYDRSYTPANMTVVAVGGMSLEQFVELLSKSPFAVTKAGVRTSLPVPLATVKLSMEHEHTVSVSEFTTEPLTTCSYRSTVCLPGILKGSAMRVARRMLRIELGREVREKRAWSYTVEVSHSDYGDFLRASFGVQGLKMEALEKFGGVLDAVIEGLYRKRALFEEVRKHTIDSYQMIDLSGSGVFEGAMDDIAKCHRIITFGAALRGLQKVRFDDVRAVLHWLRPEQRWTCIVKP